jgi:hypothetical protein
MPQSNRTPSRFVLAVSVVSALAWCAGQAFAAGAAGGGGGGGASPADQLLGQYPGLMSSTWNDRPIAFAGVPMNGAKSAEQAASDFVNQHADAFGAGQVELVLSRVNELSFGRQTVFAYTQVMDGVPVEFGMARVLVLNTFEDADAAHKVVLASAKLAQRPAEGFADVTVSPEEAVAKARSLPRYAGLKTWSEPELVVFYGEGDFDAWITPIRAWKFVGSDPVDPSTPTKYTCFVDASTGELVHARNDITHVDITGQVRGNVSPNNTADWSGNPPVQVGVPEIQVRVQGTSTSVFTDRSGNFSIPWSGSSPVTLEVGVAAGRRVTVNDTVSPEILLTQSATPGTPATLVINATPSEVTTAQTNAFVYQTQTRNFVADYAPTFAAQLDTIGNSTATAILPANTAVAGSCNAFYDGISTNYYPFSAVDACNNTAFASVISHEYGHHVVNRLGLAQGAFGEGFSDTISILLFDDPIIGRYFRTSGSPVRQPAAANQQYPCTSTAIHTCGMILGGTIWDIRTGLGTKFGSAQGLQVARQLHLDWAQTAIGGIGLNSAHPTTALEYLAVDDIDGNLCNGTPNYAEIRTAFNNHGISVPNAETRASIALVGSVPSSISSGQALELQLDITPGTATITPGSPRVLYRHQSTNSFMSQPLTLVSGNRYSTSIPSANCGQTIELSFVVTTSAGDVSYPTGCDIPAPIRIPAYDSVTTTTENFETANAGWTVGPNTATTGIWTRVNPLGTAAQPEDDTTSAPGVNCWVTGQGTSSTNTGEQDVDGGRTILTSPAFNLSGFNPSFVTINYNRWFNNNAGSNPYDDAFRIEASSDNGTTWVPAETVGPGSAANSTEVSGGWRSVSWSLASRGLAATSGFRIRFIAEDAGVGGSIVEAAIDDLRIIAPTCSISCNDIDFNNDNLSPDAQDIDDYLSVLSGGPGACSSGNCDDLDFNRDGLVPDSADLDALLSRLSGGPCL